MPYSSIARLWNSPSRPVMPWTTSRVSRPMRMLTPRARRAAATALAAASSRLAAVTKLAASQQLGRLGRVGADDPDDHRHVALLLGARLDQAAARPRRRG